MFVSVDPLECTRVPALEHSANSFSASVRSQVRQRRSLVALSWLARFKELAERLRAISKRSAFTAKSVRPPYAPSGLIDHTEAMAFPNLWDTSRRLCENGRLFITLFVSVRHVGILKQSPHSRRLPCGVRLQPLYVSISVHRSAAYLWLLTLPVAKVQGSGNDRHMTMQLS